MTGTPYYDRKLSIVLGEAGKTGLDFSQFRVTFSVRRGDQQTPNSVDCRIYNLSTQTQNQVKNEFDTIVLQAGYANNFGLIFRGDIKQIRSGRENAKDTYLDITAADGDEAYNFSYIRYTQAAGGNQDQSLAAFVNSFGGDITQGYKPTFQSNGCVRGQVFYGATKDELREFASQNDCTWSIQEGKLTIIPLTSYIPGAIPVLSPTTGLIGQPEQIQNGISMRVLLNPGLKIGQLVKLDSSVTINQLRFGLDGQSQGSNGLLQTSIKSSADGTYYVMRADHSGDSRGGPWYTDLICLATDATIPPGLASQAAVAPAAAAIKRF